MSGWNERLQKSGMTERMALAPHEAFSARLRRLWRNHGLIGFVGLALAGVWRWLFYRPLPLQYIYCPWLYLTRTPRTFRFEGEELRYFYHAYNTTWNVERAVEVSIARHLLQRYGQGRVLEVGNVLAHYLEQPRVVVDKFETAPGVLNVDIVDYRPEQCFDLILAISTLEHVGWDDDPREPEKALRALEHLASLLAPSGMLLVTLPIGYNSAVDIMLREGRMHFDRLHFFKRITSSEWREVASDDAWPCLYGTPFNAANAIAVGILERN